ncbi:XRE family transcriptional regulator [Priestia megaterium]|uniref:XRE family transcriptional regulator n=1 Tax=Priestia megaterium TaxID=1404 RepID=UPI00204098C5|nr:XRE family transcriptional regulator [Priestia megaterium]MCM3186382.1 XRE family transcriptional regulator [Priestia megaterium]
MTKRKERNLVNIGRIIYKHRIRLSLDKESRKFFLDDRVRKGLLEEGDISEKTLANIENGYNLPSLITLNYLATALELDLLELIEEVKPYIPRR